MNCARMRSLGMKSKASQYRKKGIHVSLAWFKVKLPKVGPRSVKIPTQARYSGLLTRMAPPPIIVLCMYKSFTCMSIFYQQWFPGSERILFINSGFPGVNEGRGRVRWALAMQLQAQCQLGSVFHFQCLQKQAWWFVLYCQHPGGRQRLVKSQGHPLFKAHEISMLVSLKTKPNQTKFSNQSSLGNLKN